MLSLPEVIVFPRCPSNCPLDLGRIPSLGHWEQNPFAIDKQVEEAKRLVKQKSCSSKQSLSPRGGSQYNLLIYPPNLQRMIDPGCSGSQCEHCLLLCALNKRGSTKANLFVDADSILLGIYLKLLFFEERIHRDCINMPMVAGGSFQVQEPDFLSSRVVVKDRYLINFNL